MNRQGVADQHLAWIQTNALQPMGGCRCRLIEMVQGLQADPPTPAAASAAHQHPWAWRQQLLRQRFRSPEGHPATVAEPLQQLIGRHGKPASHTAFGSSLNSGPDGHQPGASPGATGVGPCC